MIEVLKQRPKVINQKNLNHVNSWWDKILIKNSHDVAKYIKRFQKDSLIISTDSFTKKRINYQDYLNFSNKTLEFLLQKEKLISQEIKIVQKFQKMINSFGIQAGILATIQTIDLYFKTIEQKTIAQKKLLAIELGNKIILQIYQAYQQMLLKILGQDEIIKAKLETLFMTDKKLETQLFDGSLTLKIIFKFAKLALRTKKISQQEFAIIFFNSVFITAYLQSFSNLYYHLITQIK